MNDAYWIIGLLVIGIVIFTIVIRYRISKISVKMPGGFAIDAEGKTPIAAEPARSAETQVGGSIKGSTIITSGRTARTTIAGDLEESDVLTENSEGHGS